MQDFDSCANKRVGSSPTTAAFWGIRWFESSYPSFKDSYSKTVIVKWLRHFPSKKTISV